MHRRIPRLYIAYKLYLIKVEVPPTVYHFSDCKKQRTVTSRTKNKNKTEPQLEPLTISACAKHFSAACERMKVVSPRALMVGVFPLVSRADLVGHRWFQQETRYRC